MAARVPGDSEEGGAERLRSISELMGEAAGVSQRGLQAWAEVQDDWEQRSLGSRPWTTDTVMNEVVNSWERVTPLIGEAIDVGIAGMTLALRSWWPAGPSDVSAIRDSIDGTPVGEVLGPYLDVQEDAMKRMATDDYRSADVVEHWAQLFGMGAKSAWRAAAESKRSTGDDRHEQTEPEATGDSG